MTGSLPLPRVISGYRPSSASMLDEEEKELARVEAERRAGLPARLVVATWNTEWAPRGRREAVRERLALLDADVIVLTEGDAEVLPDRGHTVDGGDYWGYDVRDPARRKVILWSKHPLRMRDPFRGPSEDIPPGRFARASIETSAGWVTFIAVCIPWRGAHVTTGRGDATPWSEHLEYLECLRPELRRAAVSSRACVLGDFNQRIPRRYTPAPVHEALQHTLSGFTVVTSGAIPGLGSPGVDHIAVTPGLLATDVRGIDRHDSRGTRQRSLSDHDLVMCHLSCRSGSEQA